MRRLTDMPRFMRRSITRVLALLLLVTVSACGAHSSTPWADPADGVWEQVAGFPLSPRTGVVMTWTGTEVVFAGGNTGWICPPNADCAFPDERSTEVAAWNPTQGSWRELPDLPRPVLGGWWCQPCGWSVGGAVVIDAADEQGHHWLVLDPASEQWRQVPDPGMSFIEAVHDDRLWGLRGRDVVSWDPLTDDLRVEATYDVDPGLQERQLFLVEGSPVVAGVDRRGVAPDEPTLTQVDVLRNGTWTRMGTQQIGWMYGAVGTRMFGIESHGADGGEVNGWDRWYPAAGVLDTATGRWRELDLPKRSRDWDGWVFASVGAAGVLAEGHWSNGVDGEWVDLGRPDSPLDTELQSVWADGRLVVFGGVDEEQGYDAPSGPEVWTWSPPVASTPSG